MFVIVNKDMIHLQSIGYLIGSDATVSPFALGTEFFAVLKNKE